MGCGKKRASFAYAGDLRHKAQSLVALSERPFVQRGNGCPYCANRKVLPGFNDLATAAPLVAKQWHETLNGALTPEMVTAGSHKKAWWQCSYGHVWKATIYSRAGVQQCGCPVCAGKAKQNQVNPARGGGQKIDRLLGGNNMKRRLLASIMTLVMMLSLLPTAVWAANTGDESATQETGDNAEPTPQSGEEETPRETATSKELDLADGSIVITETGYTQGNAESETAYTGEYTISGTTTENTITVTGGDHTITLNSVNIDVSGMHDGDDVQKAKACAFDIQSGDVTLTLEGENVLTSGFTYEGYETKYNLLCATGWVCAGLSVERGASVVINGEGSLDVKAGGSNKPDGTNYVIDEKPIYWANAGKAAGIGASCRYSNYSLEEATAGDIIIENGIVVATGSSYSTGYGGPGIGGGSNPSNITISGGTITAKSGYQSSGCAAIGGAYSHSGKKHIVISGGTVTATGGSAGIGGGAYQPADVTISGNDTVVTATGHAGAGIGSGGGAYSGDADKVGATAITITGGKITATGSAYSAGIGGGGMQANTGETGGRPSGTITISGGDVTANGGQNAPGIGSGSLDALQTAKDTLPKPANGMMEIITISGGKVTANNGSSYISNEGLPYRLSDGNVSLATGIGQGVNAGSDAVAAYPNWKLQTGRGDAVQLLAAAGVAGLMRNGESYTPATLVIGSTEYYLLPEGCYKTSAEGAEEMIPASAATAEEVTSLITGINGFTTKEEYTQEDVKTVQGYEETYKGLSESLQYYVDQKTKDTHTLSKIKEGFVGKVKVTVTLKNGEKTFETTPVTYGNSFNFSGFVPTKANYRLDGWYLDETNMTSGDNWPYLSDTTLEAKWVSEITGEGTEKSPYIIKSGANLVALSHISLYGWDSVNKKNVYAGTEEEFALFGKDGVSDANRAELMLAYYKLGDNVTLTTADKFYGISGFKGHFNGDDHTITLNIDTTNIVESSDRNESGSEVAVGASTKRGKLKLTIGERTVYVNINMGVFNSATGAKIENFTTSGSAKVLTNSAFTGVVIGESYGCTIKNITNEATLELGATDNTSWAGGIAGTVGSTNATTFENCYNEGTIKAGTFDVSIGNSSAAGICSYQNASATFTNCSNSGELIAERRTDASGRYSNVGGIVGLAAGAITAEFTNCRNTGALSSQAQTNNAAAGIVVVNGSNVSVKLDSCSNAAALSAKQGYAGALVSYKSGPSGMPTSATYTDCTHNMTGDAAAKDYKVDSVSAVAGENGEFTISVPIQENDDNFYSADRYVIDGSGAKVADIASANYHYIYNDFTHNDNILEKNYPFQTEETAYVISSAEDYTNLVMALRGDATAQTAVLGNRFSDATADAKAVMLSNIYVKLNNNITLSDLNAIGIGTDEHPFGGTILGQNHTVTYALSSDALPVEQSSKVGFIGVSNGATVQDLSFAGNVNVQIDPENGNNVYFGAAVVDGSGATVKNCHSKVNYTVSRTTTVKNATGGFLKVGGLLGAQASATVEDSSYKGTIAVTSPKFARAGGIAAEIDGTVKNCKVEGDVSATLEYDAALPVFGEDSHAGGIAGAITSASTIENCMAVGSVSAKNTVNSDAVSGAYRYACAGGLIGNNTAAVTVKDCMALTTETANASMGASYQCAGAFAGKEDKTLTLSGTNWYVMTDTVSVSDASAKPIDTTVLNGKTFGETVEMTVPTGVTMSSDYASLTGSTVSFIKAGNGTVNLVYDGQTFFTTDVAVDTKKLSEKDVTITGINSAYPSDDDAAAAKANISVIYGDKKLVEGTDYTVKQESNKFVINFIGNYTGSAEKSYTVEAGTLVVTAKDYTGIYDGEAHSIIVNAPEGATVEYGTEKTSYSTTNVKEKNAGTYVVYWKVSKEGSETVTGSAVISIVKAPLTIKADNQSMYVGGKLPTFTYTATGLVKGETLTHVDLTCEADGKTTGKFDIVPSSADAGNNYKITYVNGTLTVSRRHSSPSSTTPDPEPTPDDSNSFSDVPANAYFADAVKWAVENGVTNGLTDTMFGPYASCTRAQIVTFLWRAGGSPEPKTMSSFTDVPASAYYAKAVAWAVENGITNGMTETTFAPNATCTRGQSVTFLHRVLKGTASSSTNFTDVKSDAFYADAINWAVANNVTNGTSNTTFSPNADCTRAEIVTFLYRAYQGK